MNEPVGYIIEYEISALIFLMVIIVRYFSARRFPNRKNRLFAVILWTVFADMALDVVSSVVIDNVFMFPSPVTYAVNITFYTLQIILPLLMTCYSLEMADQLNITNIKKLIMLFTPGVALIILLFFNPLTHLVFYVDPNMGYVRGILFLSTYGVCLFYMLVTLIVTYRNRESLRREEYMTIYRFLSILFVSMVIQFFVPEFLITGVAIALAVILMYFTIQNPDTMVDTTTGAFTYEAILTFLNDRVREHDKMCFVAVKIYNMSRINELMGIENGSALLKQVSKFMRVSARDSWVFRMHGSCFIAVTRRTADYISLCEQVTARVDQPWLVGGTEVFLNTTVCCASDEVLFDSPLSSEDAVNYLETAFIQNEHSKNRVKIITLGLDSMDKIRRRRAVEAALREALVTGEGLELYFQPLWSVKKQRFASAEVLLRFHHPVMGMIYPDEFVPIAESNGLVMAMDEVVVRKACDFLHEFDCCRFFGLDQLEINLSALEFMHRSLPELLREIITFYDVDPARLCFEITETAATESFDLLRNCMLRISEFGCGFALDDFGTGYANISQVIQLPFSIVKLDKSLLYGSNEVLEDMARMFKRMKRSTVVEGVETAEQVELLESFNVDYIQGYYYAKPMCRSDFLRFLETHFDAELSIGEITQRTTA